MGDELLGKVIAITREGIVIVSVPEIAKVDDNVIDLVHRIVCDADWNALLELEPSTSSRGLPDFLLVTSLFVYCLDADNA